MIKLESIDKEEAFRYMGGKFSEITEEQKCILDENEKILLDNINVRYVYKVFELDDETMTIKLTANGDFREELFGKSIRKHLKGCDKVILLAATLSDAVDAVIRKRKLVSISDMVSCDALASAAIEDALKLIDEELKEKFNEYHLTWRFGVGYGDFPLDFQGNFLELINARKLIGLSLSEGGLLTPTKSVTGIYGLSKEPLPKSRALFGTVSKCDNCSFKDKCNVNKECGKA